MKTKQIDLSRIVQYFDMRLSSLQERILVAVRMSNNFSKAPTEARLRRAYAGLLDVMKGQEILMLEVVELCESLMKGDEDENSKSSESSKDKKGYKEK